ncbi:MAG: M13 family metallopeptidase [Bdellovibrionales bacterium]
MKQLLIALVLALLFQLSCAKQVKPTVSAKALVPAPSSEIPPKREFPVNPAVNPCDNFYEYTCSLVNQSFKLRDDRSRHTFSFSDSSERILEARKEFLAGLSNNKKLTPRGRTLRTVFNACMNVDASRSEEIKLVKGVETNIQKLDTHKEFQKFLAKNILSEDLSVIGFDNIASHDNPDKFDLLLMTDLQSLPERSYYDKKEVYSDFEGVVAEFFKTLDYTNAEQRAKAVVQFEKDFAQTYPLPVEIRQLFATKTGITREELEKQYPNLHLSELLQKIPKKTHIRNIMPKAFEFVNKALEQTPLNVLKDVYLFHASVGYMDDAYPVFYQKYFDFRKKHLGGPEKRSERNERCTDLVETKFDKELDAEMLPLLFPNFPSQKVFALSERVRSALLAGIEKNQWLSPESKKTALRKMKTARLQLVKPRNEKEWNFNPPAKYTETTPYQNIRNLHYSLMKKTLREFSETRDRNLWYMGPLVVNAYYNPADNKFVMPIGILQYPFYDPSLPVEVNLAAVGMVVGHELGHGIDDNGAKYNEKGQLIPWMSKEDLNTFKTRGAKLISQFDKIGHNGTLTLGENIGDLVGLTSAYEAAFPKARGDVKLKQAFFTQYGRLWCTVARPKWEEKALKTDSHAMGYARVNEQIKHQPGFAEAFSCPAGSPMTLPEGERVRIW